MLEDNTMSEDSPQAKMHSMMEQCCSEMSAGDKKEMFAAMMGKMSEDLDMKEMMPEMMMGMMCGGEGEAAGKTQDMMSKMKQGGPAMQKSHMPEMMLKTMMPHCIGMTLPKIDPEKRGELGAAVLSAIVESGSAGMSDEQTQRFVETLGEALHPSA